MTEKIVKDVGELTPQDFRDYPIWGWYDDDRSLAMPVEETYLFLEDYIEDDPRVFIVSDLTLCDGTHMQGEIAVRIDEKRVYQIGFFQKDELVSFSLAPLSRRIFPLERLLHRLGKSLEQVFPIKYGTHFFFRDGTPIAGTLDLEDRG